MYNIEKVVLDEHGVFEMGDVGLAELVSGGTNQYCYDEFCANNTCVQAVCAQSLCVSPPTNVPCPPQVNGGACIVPRPNMMCAMCTC